MSVGFFVVSVESSIEYIVSAFRIKTERYYHYTDKSPVHTVFSGFRAPELQDIILCKGHVRFTELVEGANLVVKHEA